jgi:Protein of unknown function (DUF3095)
MNPLNKVSSLHFYRDIKALRLPVAKAFEDHSFFELPPDWFVVIADIKNSTAAVAEGKHNDVNLIAAGSLIAALNIAKEKGVEIPFFFSGDGGAVIVPSEIADDVVAGLHRHNENASKNFGLTMHIGSLSVADISSSGAALRIAKIQIGENLSKALLVGNGLKVAEQQIKRKSGNELQIPPSDLALNMTGLECRWDKVKPPTDENEIVCYLVEATNQAMQTDVYRDVLTTMDDIYGPLEGRSPLSVNRLKLLLNLKKIENEMKAKFGGWRIRYYVGTFLENFLGLFFFGLNLKLGGIKGQDYLSQLIANADTLTIDGRINTIISGKTEKRKLLVNYLKTQEEKGVLIFGHHISKESIMTCYIENINAKHIHFVDGSDGGYTEASKELKAKAVTPKSP